MENIKKYWFLYTPILALIIWGVSINSRLFNSPEQKVRHETYIENAPSTKDLVGKHIRDSINTVHAMQIRQQRYEDNKIKDSIRAVNDSLFLDMVTRQTVQIEQVKEEVQKIKRNY